MCAVGYLVMYCQLYQRYVRRLPELPVVRREEKQEAVSNEMYTTFQERKIMHFRLIENSVQLQDAMTLLSDYLPHTTEEIRRATGSVCPATLMSEIRANGIPMSEAKYAGLTNSNNRVYEYHLLHEEKTVDRKQLSTLCTCGLSFYIFNGNCNKCGKERIYNKADFG